MIAAAPTMLLRLLLAGSLAVVAGCSWVGWGSQAPQAHNLPAVEGLYADTGTQLVRLDGNPEWEVATWDERANLDPYIRFLVYHSALGQLGRPVGDAVRLQKAVWVRSQIDADGSISPVGGERWVVSNLERFAVPVDVRQVDGRADVVQAVPLQPLEPGLYSLQLQTSTGHADLTSRFGVHWPHVDRQAYSAATCVDRYLGAGASYRPCGEQADVLSAQGLALYLVDPEVQPALDGRAMRVQGVIVNTSDQPRRVPSLEGNLRAVDGRVLHQWQFATQATELGPGESTAFRTEVRNPPAGTHDVNVKFAMIGG